MRVLFLQQQPCIRTLKYAEGLRSQGDTLHLGFACQGRTLTEFYGEGDELFDRWWPIDGDAADVARVVADFAPDVIHCHNLPDRLTVVALEVTGGAVPVVHDVHDLQSLRHTAYEDGFAEPAEPLILEKQAIVGSAAVVTVSEEMTEEVVARHGRPRRMLCFPNYAVGRHLPQVLPPPDRPASRPPRLVYQGTLSTNGGHYDLREIFAAVVAGGVSLDVYPARALPEYRALAEATPGLTCHEMLPPARLLEVLPEYDFGWAGFNASLNRAHLDTALPNKAFEYLGCGLPVLTFDHRALTLLVDRHGVGVGLTTLDGLADRLAALDLVALRRRVAGVRNQLTVEANIHRLAGLYRELADS
jgi:glycosyltransferase involved in cell wall biosynthesis